MSRGDRSTASFASARTGTLAAVAVAPVEGAQLDLADEALAGVARAHAIAHVLTPVDAPLRSHSGVTVPAPGQAQVPGSQVSDVPAMPVPLTVGRTVFAGGASATAGRDPGALVPLRVARDHADGVRPGLQARERRARRGRRQHLARDRAAGGIVERRDEAGQDHRRVGRVGEGRAPTPSAASAAMVVGRREHGDERRQRRRARP